MRYPAPRHPLALAVLLACTSLHAQTQPRSDGTPALARVPLASSTAMVGTTQPARLSEDQPPFRTTHHRTLLLAARLPAVTVTATGHEEDALTAPASVTVIDREHIQNRASDDLLDAVQDTPGLSLSPRQAGGRKTFSLRGMNDAHTLMLVDGRRISATDDVVGHSDYQYGWVPMSAVERVEVIRGPLSALYGSEALGGVVNVITRWPTEKWEGAITLSAQRAADHQRGGTGSKASIYAAGPLGENLALRIDGEKGHVGSIATPDRTLSEIEGRRPGNAGITARYTLNPQHRFEVGWRQGREDRFYNDTSVRGVRYQNLYKLDREQTHAQWNGSFGQTQAQLRAYRSAIEVRNYRTNGVTPTRLQDMRDVVYDGSVSHRMDRHHLAAGVEARRETLVNAGLRNGRDSADHRALFLQDEISLGSSLMATLGVRVDHHEIFGNETSPRAYLVWQATPELTIKGGYGEAFKAPTLKQISSNYVGAEGPHTFYGNDNIRPETSRSFELAADYRIGPLTLRSTLFQNKVKDLIYLRLLRQQGIRNFYQYDNVNRARIRGAELGLGWDITPNLHWNNDVTLLHARDGNGAELVNRPRSVVHSRLRWEAPRDFDLRLGAHYTGRQRVSANTRLPGYTLTDASIGQKINPHVSWRVGLDNLGNLRLAEKSPDFGYAIRGRTWFTQLQIEF